MQRSGLALVHRAHRAKDVLKRAPVKHMQMHRAAYMLAILLTVFACLDVATGTAVDDGTRV